MTYNNINELYENVPSEWPKVEVVGIPEGPTPKFTSGLMDLEDSEQVDELVDFFKKNMIPQLACAPDGSSPAYPHANWITAEGRTAVVVRAEDGSIAGAWIIKNNGIYYPCAVLDNIALIYRTLWDETIKHFDYVWGSTANPTIMAFAKKAVRVPPSPNSPTVTDDRLEWRRP